MEVLVHTDLGGGISSQRQIVACCILPRSTANYVLPRDIDILPPRKMVGPLQLRQLNPHQVFVDLPDLGIADADSLDGSAWRMRSSGMALRHRRKQCLELKKFRKLAKEGERQ